LLVACAPDAVTEVLSIFLQQGFGHVSVVGEMVDEPVGVTVI
jgi:selenide, water dikinase